MRRCTDQNVLWTREDKLEIEKNGEISIAMGASCKDNTGATCEDNPTVLPVRTTLQCYL